MVYQKPIIVENEDLSEGIYASSGDTCYTVTTNIHQRPEIGRGDYRIQVNGSHAAMDNHHGGVQILIVTFNQPVVYSVSNGEYMSGSGTNTIRIKYSYHQNGNDNIGLGDLIVVSDAGLSVINAVLECNHDCGQH